MITAERLHSWLLESLEPGEPRHHRNLSWIPLRLRPHGQEHPVTFVPAPRALTDRTFVVRETGSVQSLSVENTGDAPVFLPAGMYLRGGGQDRMVTVSLVIAAHGSGVIPVRCVEHHRWNPSERQTFSTPESGSMSAANTIRGSDASTDQSAVWESVADVSNLTGTVSNSSRLGAVYESTADARAEYAKTIGVNSETALVGSFCYIWSADNRVHCSLDVFGNRELFQAFLNPLRDSLTLTALHLRGQSGNEGPPPSTGDLYNHLDYFLRAASRPQKLREERVESNSGKLFTRQTKANADVAVLEYDGHLVHVIARFNGTKDRITIP